MSRSVLAANSEIEPMLIHPQLGGIETINNNMTTQELLGKYDKITKEADKERALWNLTKLKKK